MSLREIAEKGRRVVVRETAGRILRAKIQTADNTEKIADLVMLRHLRPGNLQPEDFVFAGRQWAVDPAILHALADAESAGAGFEADGRAIIMNEPHAFSEATSHAFDLSHPDRSYPAWIRYEKGAPPPKGMRQHPYTLDQDGRWALFVRQAELSVEGACSALSVGRFQQLVGRTPSERRKGRRPAWQEFGFLSAEALFRFLCVSEFHQLEVLYQFLVTHDLMDPLRRRDWRVIAARYNGSGQVEAYSQKMAEAWKRRTRTYA